MRNIGKRLDQLESESWVFPQAVEFWTCDDGLCTSMESGEALPKDELEARPCPDAVRRIVFVTDVSV